MSRVGHFRFSIFDFRFSWVVVVVLASCGGASPELTGEVGAVETAGDALGDAVVGDVADWASVADEKDAALADEVGGEDLTAETEAEVDTADVRPGDALGDGDGEALPDIGQEDLAGSDAEGDSTQDTAPACSEGVECDDGNPCTVSDWCTDGVCTGVEHVCDDFRACTLDKCDGLGNCQFTLKVGRCLINGLCALDGSNKPGNPCLFCNPAKDPFSWTEKPMSPCDDEDACTTGDACMEGKCSGDPALCNDSNPCTLDICDPDEGCTHTPANIPCDDGDPCTGLDFCEAGECKGGPAPGCNDANPCTQDTCQPGKGCFHSKFDGIDCDDGDACTVGDVCADGECEPGKGSVSCDDWNDCTDDICDPLKGCTYPLNGNPCCINDINVCDDSDPCTIDSCNVNTGACIYLPNEGSCTDKDACTQNDVCVQGACTGVPKDCDDASVCTLDFCDKKQGCLHENLNMECDDFSVCTLNDWCQGGKCVGTKVNCNDYNLCTDDSCDPMTGCVNAFNSAACNDYDLCTSGDKCNQGKCIGEKKSCNDSNPCTDDSCAPSSGCQDLFNTAACDDKDDCTQGDACSGGVCVPGKVVCASCKYEFSEAVNRTVKMAISTDKKQGNALDLDGNGTLDNSMAGISSMANDPLQKALDKGDVHLLLEHHGIKTNGGIYTLAMFVGALAPGFEQCAFAADYCGYIAKKDAIDQEKCQALVFFDNASIFQGKLVAGGKKYKFPWQVPIAEGTSLDIVLYSATIQANVTVQQGIVTVISGIIGGAIPKQSFVDAINAVPDDKLPMPKDMILQLLQVLVTNDIDTDGNGSKDAASIAIKFEGIAAGIVGAQ